LIDLSDEAKTIGIIVKWVNLLLELAGKYVLLPEVAAKSRFQQCKIF